MTRPLLPPPTAAEIATAKAEAASLRAQHAELNAELLDLARRYDPNCDMYVYEDQANAMDAARQTVEAMQELAEFLGRDPEGCLVDCADEAAGRIERAEDEIAELRAKLAAAEREREALRVQWTGQRNEREEEYAALRRRGIRFLRVGGTLEAILPESEDTAAAPFDDERPVDEAWLLSIGFSLRPDDHGNTLRIQLDNYAGWIRHLECCDKANLPDTPWEIASYCEDGTDERAMLTDKIETRGQLLKLLAALKPGGVK